jgi:Zn-dependent peptidase ImmA (M78 family)
LIILTKYWIILRSYFARELLVPRQKLIDQLNVSKKDPKPQEMIALMNV